MNYVMYRCLEDCGNDAHRHVVHCALSLQPGGVWGTQAQFQAVHRQQRQEAIRRYLAESALSPECQEDLRGALARDVADLGIVL